MSASRKRVSLKSHVEQIRRWTEEGKRDEWIANALGTSSSSVQSFRSRHRIRRRRKPGRSELQRSAREPESVVFEGVLDHGERDGWGLWFDPRIAEDPVYREHWAAVESVVVKIGKDSIVVEIDGREGTSQNHSADGAAVEPTTFFNSVPEKEAGSPRERGRVKWFDPEKGYGFLARPGDDDLFVHHSEVEADLRTLEPEISVEYEIKAGERGPVAARVRLRRRQS